MNKKNKINYLFAILFFIALFFIYFSHAFSLKNLLLEAKLYFLSISAIQTLFEITIFLLTGLLIKSRYPLWIYRIYTSALFLVFLFHLTDYVMLRLMDQSLGTSLKIFMTLNLRHLLAAFRAMNLNISFIITIFLVVLMTPVVGMLLYYFLEKIGYKKSFYLSFRKGLLFAFSLLMLSLSFDLFLLPLVKKEHYIKIKKALPFGTTFLRPNFPMLTLKTKKQEKYPVETSEILQKKDLPNIYLFIVETFRKDYLTKEYTPFLYEFQEQCCQIPHSFANANATPLSWFSIFHAKLPYNWQTTLNESDKKGALPLKLLKQKGYKIRLYSSADLHYFHMGENIFGKHFFLCDEKQEFFDLEKTSPWKRDSHVISCLNADLQNKKHHQNTLFIVFLDSPHSEYSYPNFLQGYFGKTVEHINYLSTDLPGEIDRLKNRYKTSLYYIDILFKSFFDVFSRVKNHENSIICVTGDHGEEFLEDGALFHGSHLNDAQIKVPFLLKLGQKKTTRTLATHVDIFPTLLTHLNTPYSQACFDGSSLMLPKNNPFALTVQQNGTSKPEVFSISNENNRIIARFIDEKTVELISVDDHENSLKEIMAEIFESL